MELQVSSSASPPQYLTFPEFRKRDTYPRGIGGLMIKQSLAAMIAMAFLWSPRIGYPASDDNFYRGKTIRLIVAFSAGGGYDVIHAPSGAIWANTFPAIQR